MNRSNLRQQPLINIFRCLALAVLCGTTFYPRSIYALYSGLTGFSQAFLHDYEAAGKMADSSKSAEPFFDLLTKYTSDAEKAELETTTGLIYNQRTGVVDPAKAITHFTIALGYQLPEKNYIQVVVWRSGSEEQLKMNDEALKDCLRVLLACSYHDLSGGWPEIKSGKETIYINSPDPTNEARRRDYARYRQTTDQQQFILSMRYYMIEAMKRLGKDRSWDQAWVVETLETLSPDASRYEIIKGWLDSENKRPWP